EFNDKSKISSYAYNAVKLVNKMSIMGGKPGNMFDPRGYTTREETAKIIDRFIYAIE
ncbi:MAG: S-layer homology domain-containing protein, partial [Bacillota bacterium]